MGTLEVDKLVERTERCGVRTALGGAVRDDGFVELCSDEPARFVVAFDDFKHETRGERGDVAEHKRAVGIRIGGVEIFADDLCVVERSKHREENVVVGKVDIDGLVEREVGGVRVERAVLGGDGSRIPGGVGETVEEFAHPSDALSFTARAHDTVITRELKIEIVLKPIPLVFSKERAEVRIAQRNRLVRAQALHTIHHLVCQFET